MQTAVDDLWCDHETGSESTYGPINEWDTSTITDMSSLFSFKTSFNGNMSTWDVTQVMNMGSMFYDASSFKQPIGEWDEVK